MNITKREKTIKELLLGKCWSYLHDNFHKFNEDNQIKIALTLAQKDLPTEVTGDGLGHTQVIIIRDRQQESTDGTPHHSERLSGSLSLVRE